MRWQGKSRRTYTGGKVRASRSRRKFEIGRESADTHINETKRKLVSTKGGNRKVRLLQCNVANVTNLTNGKTVSSAIENVIENVANEHHVRRNIITKGAIIVTALGNARVTSRPGQDGVVNAVLVE
ncbi:MAG: 30S ribosomal protein S8e [Methanosarcinaceae archaeon]|nr:30S ribosomal protein S8e [Methanosarcinaceae archaeon]MDF1533026.1 30S ribosomal protein S8e [Methanosarcinaceae archaeon]MDO9518458.1 30S ribosomal protein S8e [Methanosarcinaceae archaeon]